MKFAARPDRSADYTLLMLAVERVLALTPICTSTSKRYVLMRSYVHMHWQALKVFVIFIFYFLIFSYD
jgi:hypothetical protein